MIVFDILVEIFHRRGLKIRERQSDYLKVGSDKISIVVAQDPRDNSNLVEVGRNEDFLFPINDKVLKEVFKSSTPISSLSSTEFVLNLAQFFSEEGKMILDGDAATLAAIEKSVRDASEDYTADLLHNQNVDAANRAWDEGNYSDFIKCIDKAIKHKLPPSVMMKYRMAHAKRKG